MNGDPRDTVVRGVLSAILWVVAVEFFIVLASWIGGMVLLPEESLAVLVIFLVFQMGMIQVLYLVPLAIAQRRKGLKERAHGIFVVSGLLFLVGGLCNAAFYQELW